MKWEPYQNPIYNDDWSYRSSEEQIPQMVESNKNRVEIWEPKEAYYSLHTQEVKWKIRIAGTGIEKVQIDRDPIVQWTVAEPLVLRPLGLPFSEKQIPQVVEKLESGGKPKKLWSVRYAPNGRCAVRKQVSSHVAMFSKHHALVGLSARWIQPGKNLSGQSDRGN